MRRRVVLRLLCAIWVVTPVSILCARENSQSKDQVHQTATFNPLDLEARSLYAVRAMQSTIDPKARVPWIMAYLTPTFHFDIPTAMIAGEYLDGLTMAKLITGSDAGDEARQVMQFAVLHSLDDGLAGGTILGALGTDLGKKKSKVELAGHKHLLPSLLNLYRFDSSNSEPLDLVRESLQTFQEIAKKGQLDDGRPYVYFPVPESVPDLGMFSFIAYDRDHGWGDSTREPVDTGSAGFQGAVILPFAQYYQLTHDPAAAEFLDQFICFVRERATDFNDDGSFTKRDPTNGQVWSRLMTNEGILIYGLASGQTELVDWARKVFDEMQNLHGTSFGWIPENLNFNHGLGCETDSMTAYIETAFLLARFVDDAYWENAERIAMNQLLEQQITDIEPLGDAEAIWGGFASFGGPNDWFVPEGPYLTQSCHGSGMRSLYNVWYHSGWWEEGTDAPTLRVNLHWSKNLPNARIVSHLPSSTDLQIDVEQPCRVVVRKPDWAKLKDITISAVSDGTSRSIEPRLRGRWLELGKFDRPAQITVDFPEGLSTREDVIRDYAKNKEFKFTTHWKGNMVVDVDPDGERRPNYAHRQDTGLGPYVPSHTAELAFDPISMTPPHSTATARPIDSIELFKAVSDTK